MKVTRKTFLVAAGSALVTGMDAETLFAQKQNPSVPPQASDINLSTPQNTMEAFIKAVRKCDAQTLVRCVDGGEPFTMPEWFSNLKKPPLTLIDPRYTIKGDTATCIVRIPMPSLEDKSIDPGLLMLFINMREADRTLGRESLQLRKVGNEWKIVPLPVGLNGYLNYFASLSRYGAQARRASLEASCVHNLNQLRTALFIYLDDKNDRFLLKAETYADQLEPYTKNERLFHCPYSDQPAVRSYAFNSALIGLNVSQIPNASRTVMLYEGSGQTLRFRHQGKAGVLFVEGFSKMVTEAEAKSLIWKPQT